MALAQRAPLNFTRISLEFLIFARISLEFYQNFTRILLEFPWKFAKILLASYFSPSALWTGALWAPPILFL